METFIIAEMEESKPELAKFIIDGAGKASANAIQLQIWAAKHMMSPQRPEYNNLTKIELTQNDWIDLIGYSRSQYPEMKIYVCVYEHQSIDFIESLNIDGYKVNSSDLSNPYVLNKIAATNKPINLSVGASSLMEIQKAIECIQKSSHSIPTLMYGFQSFPTLPENIPLSYLNKLKTLFELPVGYQDHCDADSKMAYWLPAASIGIGIDIIEKHITHDRKLKGIDHESALNPNEFDKFVQMIHNLDEAMGNPLPKPFSDPEIKYREFQKKSIVASRNLSAGTKLTYDDLTFMRAEILGLPPDNISHIKGKRIRRNIDAFKPILIKDIE